MDIDAALDACPVDPALAVVATTGDRPEAVGPGADRDGPGRRVADVAIHVGVEKILGGRVKEPDGREEFGPVLRAVYSVDRLGRSVDGV